MNLLLPEKSPFAPIPCYECNRFEDSQCCYEAEPNSDGTCEFFKHEDPIIELLCKEKMDKIRGGKSA